VRWLLAHERDDRLVFAPLQGPTAAALRAEHPRIPELVGAAGGTTPRPTGEAGGAPTPRRLAQLVDTVVLVADGRTHLRSKAFLHAARHLRAPWRWAYGVRWLPAFVLDLGYRLIARIRYRVWGRAELCDLPSPAQRARFLP
jgi:predicted DCC family thiol-disulfide oxidoreductase YuxK